MFLIATYIIINCHLFNNHIVHQLIIRLTPYAFSICPVDIHFHSFFTARWSIDILNFTMGLETEVVHVISLYKLLNVTQ